MRQALPRLRLQRRQAAGPLLRPAAPGPAALALPLPLLRQPVVSQEAFLTRQRSSVAKAAPRVQTFVPRLVLSSSLQQLRPQPAALLQVVRSTRSGLHTSTPWYFCSRHLSAGLQASAPCAAPLPARQPGLVVGTQKVLVGGQRRSHERELVPEHGLCGAFQGSPAPQSAHTFTTSFRRKLGSRALSRSPSMRLLSASEKT